jgi:hypothetical protein
MRRWICPDMKYPGHLRLFVAEPMPADAICEAPHNFTTEMEPYLELKHIIDPSGAPEVLVTWNPQYLIDLKSNKLKSKVTAVPHYSAAPLISQAKEVKALTVAEIHNSLNPFQRIAYAILGPAAHSPSPFMKVIFRNKLLGDGFVAGVKFDV